MSDSICVKYGHDFQLDLDGQVTCNMCGTMDDEVNISGSEPSPEAGYSTGKWSDDDDAHPTITPIFGPNR